MTTFADIFSRGLEAVRPGRTHNEPRSTHVKVDLPLPGVRIYRIDPALDPEHDAEILLRLARVPGIRYIRPLRLAGAEESVLLVGCDAGHKGPAVDYIVRGAINALVAGKVVLVN